MLKIKEYVKAESLEQAYELNQKRTNCILGGMLWLKMSNRNVQKAIDLSGLGLNQIEETEEEFRIGCMTTLRELECHERLNQWCEGAVKDAVSDIVGVQFRNLATIGGSIFGRYGFSDVLTVFLAMDSYVELYKGGIVPLQEFAQMKRDNDILVRVIVKIFLLLVVHQVQLRVKITARHQVWKLHKQFLTEFIPNLNQGGFSLRLNAVSI